MKKKLLVIILAVAIAGLCMIFAACGGGSGFPAV